MKFKFIILFLSGFMSFQAHADGEAVRRYSELIERGDLVPVLTCDLQAITVYVDRTERRHVTLMIRNREIVKFLDSKGAFASGIDRDGENVAADHSAAVIHGPVLNGIFHPQNFVRVESGFGGEYNMTFFEAHRENRGLKITFDDINPVRYWGLIGQCEERNGLGECTRAKVPDHRDANYYQKANWYFQDCDEDFATQR